MEILFHVPLLIIARGLCSSVFTPKPHASGLGTTYCLNIYLCHQRRYICLLHILYNYFFSFFEISRFWLEMTTLCDCVIPKQSEGSLSLFLARAGRPRPYSCLVFFLLSFYHILFMTEKYAKGPGTRKSQSTSFLVVNTAFTATRVAPISSVLRTTNCWRCRRFENSRVASDIFQSKRVLKHTPLGN